MTEEMNQALKEYNRMNTQLNQKNRAVSSWKTRMDRRTRFMKKQRGLQGKLEIRQTLFTTSCMGEREHKVAEHT